MLKEESKNNSIPNIDDASSSDDSDASHFSNIIIKFVSDKNVTMVTGQRVWQCQIKSKQTRNQVHHPLS